MVKTNGAPIHPAMPRAQTAMPQTGTRTRKQADQEEKQHQVKVLKESQQAKKANDQKAGQVKITFYTDPLCCWSWAFEQRAHCPTAQVPSHPLISALGRKQSIAAARSAITRAKSGDRRPSRGRRSSIVWPAAGWRSGTCDLAIRLPPVSRVPQQDQICVSQLLCLVCTGRRVSRNRSPEFVCPFPAERHDLDRRDRNSGTGWKGRP